MTKHYRLSRAMRRAIHVALFLVVVVALIVATIGVVGQTIGSLFGGVLIVALIAYLIGWLASGYWLRFISGRRYTDEDMQRVSTLHAIHAQSMMIVGECAVPWRDENGAHLCVRPYEHRGTHTCGLCAEITR